MVGNILRILQLIAFVVTFAIKSVSGQNACPLNFNSSNLISAKGNIKNWNGKIIAFDAVVLRVEKGPKDKPYYKVRLEDGGQLWVGSLIVSGYANVGAKLRILGYFLYVDGHDVVLKFNKDGFHILSFVEIDFATQQMSIFPGAEKQAEEWLNGYIPKAHK